MKLFLFAFLFLWGCDLCYAQERGFPFVQNFSSIDFKGHSQSWDAIEAHNGKIYVANSNSVKVFNGKFWIQ